MKLEVSGEAKIRAYHSGDERQLVEISNRYYEDYEGSLQIDEPYFKWAYTQNPLVNHDGILIVEEDGKILAFGVARKDGKVLDLCYEPNDQGRRALQPLIRGLLDFLARHDAGRIRIDGHSEDNNLRAVLADFGFSERPRKIDTVIRCVNFRSLLQQLIMRPSFPTQKIIFKLEGAPPPNEQIIIENNEVREYDRKFQRQFPIIRIKKGRLIEVIFGGTSPALLLLRGEVKVTPWHKIPQAYRTLRSLQLDTHWGPTRGPIFWE